MLIDFANWSYTQINITPTIIYIYWLLISQYLYRTTTDHLHRMSNHINQNTPENRRIYIRNESIIYFNFSVCSGLSITKWQNLFIMDVMFAFRMMAFRMIISRKMNCSVSSPYLCTTWKGALAWRHVDCVHRIEKVLFEQNDQNFDGGDISGVKQHLKYQWHTIHGDSRYIFIESTLVIVLKLSTKRIRFHKLETSINRRDETNNILSKFNLQQVIFSVNVIELQKCNSIFLIYIQRQMLWILQCHKCEKIAETWNDFTKRCWPSQIDCFSRRNTANIFENLNSSTHTLAIKKEFQLRLISSDK